MKLVFLYGPPAVGKLTVANTLAKMIDYRVFHNHLTIDLVRTIHKTGTDAFKRLVTRYRLELIEEAAKSNINLIFTFVFTNSPKDRTFVKNAIEKTQRHGGTVFFVQLLADEKTLRSRVKNTSRKMHSKISKIQTLQEFLSTRDLRTPIDNVHHLSIDNTKLSPKKVAQQIRQHFKL